MGETVGHRRQGGDDGHRERAEEQQRRELGDEGKPQRNAGYTGIHSDTNSKLGTEACRKRNQRLRNTLRSAGRRREGRMTVPFRRTTRQNVDYKC